MAQDSLVSNFKANFLMKLMEDEAFDIPEEEVPTKVVLTK